MHSYYGNCWKCSGLVYDEDNLLNDLPPNLRSIVMQQISVEAVSRIPMLKGVQDVCAAEVYVNMYPQNFEEGLIYAAREPGDEMYFVTSGKVVLHAVHLHGAEGYGPEDTRLHPKQCPDMQVVPPAHTLQSEDTCACPNACFSKWPAASSAHWLRNESVNAAARSTRHCPGPATH